MPPLEQPLTSLHLVDEQDPALPDFAKTLGGPYFRVDMLPRACDEDCSIPMAIQVWGLPSNPELAALRREQHITFFVENETFRQAVRCQLKKGSIFCKRVTIYEEKNFDGNPLFFKCSLKPLSEDIKDKIKMAESYQFLRRLLIEHVAFGIITQQKVGLSVLFFRQFSGPDLTHLDPPCNLFEKITPGELEFDGAHFSFATRDSEDFKSFKMLHRKKQFQKSDEIFEMMENLPHIKRNVSECFQIFKWSSEPKKDLVRTQQVYDFINDRLLASLERVDDIAEVPDLARELPGPYFKLTGTNLFYTPSFYLQAILVQGLPPCPELQALSSTQRVTIFFEALSQVGVVNSEVQRGKLHSKRAVYISPSLGKTSWFELTLKPPSPKKIQDLYSGQQIEDTERFQVNHRLHGMMVKNTVGNTRCISFLNSDATPALMVLTNGYSTFTARGPTTESTYQEGQFFQFKAGFRNTIFRQNVTQEGVKFSELNDSLSWIA